MVLNVRRFCRDPTLGHYAALSQEARQTFLVLSEHVRRTKKGHQHIARRVLELAVCKCEDFKWKRKKTQSQISNNTHPHHTRIKEALETFRKKFPYLKIGKVLGGGVFAKAFSAGIDQPCYSLLIREISPGQPGGIRSYSAAAATGAALPILGYWRTKIGDYTFDYILTQRLSSTLRFVELDNSTAGKELQRKLVALLWRMGEAQVVHGDEHTEGNIMKCPKDGKLYFIDFSDSADGMPTAFRFIPQSTLTDLNKVYDNLFPNLPSIETIRFPSWQNFALSLETITQTIVVYGLFQFIVAYVLSVFFAREVIPRTTDPNYKGTWKSLYSELGTSSLPLPIVLVRELISLSKGQLDLPAIVEIVEESL